MVNTDLNNVNVDLQAHITKASAQKAYDVENQGALITAGENFEFTGIAWGRGFQLTKIEYSLDGNSWKEVSYSPGSNDSIYQAWEITVESSDLKFTGFHTLLVRSVGESGSHSLSDHFVFYSAHGNQETVLTYDQIFLVLGILTFVVSLVALFRNGQFNLK